MKTRISLLFAFFLALAACTPATPTPIPSMGDIADFEFLWQGSPVPYPKNNLTLLTNDCSTPLEVSSFSIIITVDKATSFKAMWLAMIITKDSNGQVTSQEVPFAGPQTSFTFNTAGSQTFVQDIPFSLTCGHYTVAVATEFPASGGYLMIGLDIVSSLSPAPPPLAQIQFQFTQPAHCRQGPGMNYPILNSYPAGSFLPAVGVNDALDWLKLRDEMRGFDCWSALSNGDLIGALGDLPVLPDPDTPTPVPEAFSTLTPVPMLGCWINFASARVCVSPCPAGVINEGVCTP